MKYTTAQKQSLIHRYRAGESATAICLQSGIPRSTFYNHILRNKRENKSYQFRRAQLSEQIMEVYNGSNQIFGARKIKAVLGTQGIATSDRMVAELMSEMNITSIRNGAKKNHMRFSAEKKKDHLKLHFEAEAPNAVWVSDTTYFKAKGKAYYICAILDLYSRKVIAHRVSTKHGAHLIGSIFKDAFKVREPKGGLTFHSDRGTQYAAHSFQKLLKDCGVTQSFSPSGSPHHNAVMESFFASLKREELYRLEYHSVQEMKERLEKYIKFYNTERPHTTLGNRTPEAWECLFSEGISPFGKPDRGFDS